jgi:hypothetical protein
MGGRHGFISAARIRGLGNHVDILPRADARGYTLTLAPQAKNEVSTSRDNPSTTNCQRIFVLKPVFVG